MTMFIFAGDMFVMAFMIGLAIWVINRDNDANIDAAARIPLQDELPSDLTAADNTNANTSRGTST